MPPRDETGLLLQLLLDRPRYVGMPDPLAPPPPKVARLVQHAVYEKGRYIPPSATRIIALVARHADVSPDAIVGGSRVSRLVNCRYAVAKLSEEFAPRLSALAVDSALLRGEGSTLYYRSRHVDRCKLWPEYAALYERCRDELRAGE